MCVPGRLRARSTSAASPPPPPPRRRRRPRTPYRRPRTRTTGTRDPQAQADLDQRLRDAAWANDVAAARDLIARGADVNAKDETQQSAYLDHDERGLPRPARTSPSPTARRREQGQLQRDRADPRRRAGAYRRRRPADPGRRRGRPRQPAGLDRPARGDHPRQGHADLRRHRAGARGRRRRRAAAVAGATAWRRWSTPAARGMRVRSPPWRRPCVRTRPDRSTRRRPNRRLLAAADRRRRRRRRARPARRRRPGDGR